MPRKQSHGCRFLYSLGSNFCSLRYGLALIMHFSNFTMITQRVSLSIAMIAMVNGTQQHNGVNASTQGLFVDNNPIKKFNSGVSIMKNKSVE